MSFGYANSHHDHPHSRSRPNIGVHLPTRDTDDFDDKKIQMAGYQGGLRNPASSRR